MSRYGAMNHGVNIWYAEYPICNLQGFWIAALEAPSGHDWVPGGGGAGSRSQQRTSNSSCFKWEDPYLKLFSDIHKHITSVTTWTITCIHKSTYSHTGSEVSLKACKCRCHNDTKVNGGKGCSFTVPKCVLLQHQLGTCTLSDFVVFAALCVFTHDQEHSGCLALTAINKYSD